MLDLTRRERGGRLVEDQQARVVGERLGDLDHLLLRDAQRADLGLGVDLDFEPRQILTGLLEHRRLVDDEAVALGQAAEIHVLGNRQPVDQAEFLVDRRDAERTCMRRVFDDDARPEQLDDARITVGLVRAGENLDERALARPVGADQRMNLAGGKTEFRVVERADASEGLADFRKRKNRRHDQYPGATQTAEVMFPLDYLNVSVIPAKAGIQCRSINRRMDPGVRRGDDFTRLVLEHHQRRKRGGLRPLGERTYLMRFLRSSRYFWMSALSSSL
ncbi:MAG: hypothetical protein QM739_10020 [Propionivibrio sp.]